MNKQDLIKLINSLPAEDSTGKIVGVFYDRYGSRFDTDSIRVDMDGGRIIMVQQGCDQYEQNKKNWIQELEFASNIEK